MRELANACFDRCCKETLKPVFNKEKAAEKLLEPSDIDLNDYEDKCVRLCSERVARMDKLMEKQLELQFNPMFVSKYV